jgi:FlaA1/EpsC-like NDP-sugar epimerase
MIVRRSLVIATATVDLVTITFSYVIARAAWPWHRLPGLGDFAHVDPVLLATIPGWLIVFLAFGLYHPIDILDKPKAWIPTVVGAITVCILAVILVAFVVNDDDLHRAWVLTLWVIAIVLVVAGRVLIGEIANLTGTKK